MPELLTPNEVAKTLKISVRAARDLMASGEIATIDVTVKRNNEKPRRRVTVGALQQWIDSRMSPIRQAMQPQRQMRAVGNVIDRY